MTPFGACTLTGPTSSGRYDAEAAALDHRRAAHADVRVLRRDHHVAAAEQRGVAGEASARDDADERREAAEPGELREGRHVEAGDAERSPCRPAGRRRLRRTGRPAGAAARRARRGGPASCGCAAPACPRAPCSRRRRPGSGRARAPNRSPLTVARPATTPSPGVLRMRSSSDRRAACAATASEPYSTKLPVSTSAAMFSRAVRWLVLRRLRRLPGGSRRGRRPAAPACRRGLADGVGVDRLRLAPRLSAPVSAGSTNRIGSSL